MFWKASLFTLTTVVLAARCVYAKGVLSSMVDSVVTHLDDKFQIPSTVRQIIKDLTLPFVFRIKARYVKLWSMCNICEEIFKSTFTSQRTLGSWSSITNILTYGICRLLNIEPKHVCAGATTIYSQLIKYMVLKNSTIDAARFCSIVLQRQGCKKHTKDWTIPLPPPPDSPIREKQPTHKIIKIVHFTDIHYDPEYEVHSNARCDEPVCCHKGTTPESASDAAKAWGDYNYCGTPPAVFRSALEHATGSYHKPDYIYMTGDMIPHKIWDTSVGYVKEVASEVIYWLKYYSEGIPVYPALGNHDTHPANMFVPDGIHESDIKDRWLYEFIAQKWKQWVPDSTNSILKSGCYTVSPLPGFRIVSLNNAPCFIYNFWLFYDDYDPLGQLQWLVNVLTEAEKNGEVVHILAHIPSSDAECFSNCCREYVKIIHRFHLTVAAQFNGHTHLDNTILYYNEHDPPSVINAAYTSGGLNSYINVNPSYRVYLVDSGTLQVVDAETWNFDLTSANLRPTQLPHWRNTYSLAHSFGVDNLTAPNLHRLVGYIASTDHYGELYNRYRHGLYGPLNQVCNELCQLNNLCDMVTTVYGDDNCRKFTKIYREHRKHG